MTKKHPIFLIVSIILAVVFTGGAIYAYRLGAKRSQYDLLRNYEKVLTVDFDGDDAYISTADNWLTRFGADGKRVWEISVRDNVASVKTAGDKVVVSYVSERTVDVFDKESGNARSSYSLTYPVSAIAANESGLYIAVKGSLLVGSYIYWYKAYADSAYSVNIENTVLSLDISADGRSVYAVNNDHNLYKVSYDADEEKILADNFASIPFDPLGGALIGNEFVVADKQGTLHIFVNDSIDSTISTNNTACAFGWNFETGYAVLANISGKAYIVNIETGEVKSVAAPTEVQHIGVSQRGVIAFSEYRFHNTDYVDIGDADFTNAFGWIRYVAIALAVVALAMLVIAIIGMTEKGALKLAVAKKKLKFRLIKSLKSYSFVLPTFVLLAMFMYLPTVWGLILSFFDYTPGVSSRFVGFTNFIAAFNDPYFTGGIVNMLLLLVTDLVKALVPAILIAELIIALNSRRAQYWVRVLIFIPGLLPGVAVLLIWTKGIYGEYGLFNSILTLFGARGIDWLGNQNTSLLSIMLIGLPWVGQYILFYGALMSVPESYREAARLDGCNWIQTLWYVDLPAIRPQIKYVFIISFINSIQDFGRIYMTTGWDNQATMIPSLQMYRLLSTNEYGRAAAMGMIIFVFIFAFNMIFNRKSKERA